MRRGVEHHGEVNPLILQDRLRLGLSHGSTGYHRGAKARTASLGEQPRIRALAEVEDRPRRPGRQEQPAGHADRVLPFERPTRNLHVAAIARQQQHPAELRVVDERPAVPAQCAMKLVARRILRAGSKHVSRDEAGFTDAVEELVAALDGTRVDERGEN